MRGAPIPYKLGPAASKAPAALTAAPLVRTVGGLTRAGRSQAWGEALAIASRIEANAALGHESPDAAALAWLLSILAPGGSKVQA